jgi:hypothetical protein
MTREQLLRKIDEAWTMLHASYAGLTDAQMTEAGVTGDWSAKDILAHVTIWEEEALKYLPLIAEGGTPPRYAAKYGGIDTFNAQMLAHRKSLSLSRVLDELNKTHDRLVRYVAGVPDEQFVRETRFRRRLKLDTYGHYAIHARMLEAWRERKWGNGTKDQNLM